MDACLPRISGRVTRQPDSPGASGSGWGRPGGFRAITALSTTNRSRGPDTPFWEVATEPGAETRSRRAEIIILGAGLILTPMAGPEGTPEGVRPQPMPVPGLLEKYVALPYLPAPGSPPDSRVTAEHLNVYQADEEARDFPDRRSRQPRNANRGTAVPRVSATA
jgi:hypothetical protein